MPHVIRLQGPWQVIPPNGDASVTVQLPASWRDLFGPAGGRARFRRQFHLPTGLTDTDQIWIRLPRNAGSVLAVALNDDPIARAPGDDHAYNVTGSLRGFNLLEVQIEFDPAQSAGTTPGGLWAPVLLEIHSSEP